MNTPAVGAPALLERTQRVLLGRQLRGGGWASQDSQQVSVEPTCWALLALCREAQGPVAPSVNRLLTLQRPNGSWPAIAGDASDSWVTALAVLALLSHGQWKPAHRGLDWVVKTSGTEGRWWWRWGYRWVPKRVALDPAKYGWPWTPGTASWVIPTAMALLACQAAYPCCMPLQVERRVTLGQQMLLDRAIATGGWHAGPGQVYGGTLTPQTEPTAMALLALHPWPRLPAVQAALAWLGRRALELSSVYSLSWALMALAAYGRATEPARTRLLSLASVRRRQAVETAALLALALEAAVSGVQALIVNLSDG